MRPSAKAAAASLGLLLGATGLPGCGDDKGDAAKSAEKALGVDTSKSSSTVKEKHDVLVIDEKKVVDPKSGQTLSDEKKVTPVTVEKDVTTDFKSKTGEPRSSPPPR